MRCLYIFNIDPVKSPGVFKKILSKIEYLKSFITLDAVYLGNNDKAYPGLEFIKTRYSYLEHLEKIIQERQSDYDIFITRYPLASARLFRIVKKYPGKIFFEHNTIELKEQWLMLKSHKLKDILYILFKDPRNFIKRTFGDYLNEKRWGPKVLKYAKGGLCISKSVAEFEKSRCPGYKTLVQGNGIEVKEIPITEGLYNTDSLKLLFVSGSANLWHGLDRLIEGLKLYKGKKDVELHLVGKLHYHISKLLKGIPSRIKIIQYGIIGQEEISRLATKCNLGVGSLGLHRIGMYDGSTLKVKEYMAIGLPFIIDHKDVDLDDKYPYSFRVSYDNKPVEIEELISFVESLKENGFSRKEMRERSIPLIDQKIKMSRLAEFLKNLDYL